MRIMIIALVLIISGCATPSFNYSPTKLDISEPPIDSINTAYIGERLLSQGSFSMRKVLIIDNQIDFGGYDVLSGTYFKTGQDAKSETYIPDPDSGAAIIKSFIADPPKAIMIFPAKNEICVITIFNGKNCERNIQYTLTEKPIAELDAYQQTLIYNGKVGDKINVGYREFSNSMARPAFNNNVEYDLSQSKIIGYRSARLEVLEATNEFIKYKVVKNFN
ncbi:hypothetical protein [Neptunicella sp.]|uniref:hypothetical protein n=1 Tax=Neptunicella sp. TaxID=2125986 RepID=UPI003F693FC2